MPASEALGAHEGVQQVREQSDDSHERDDVVHGSEPFAEPNETPARPERADADGEIRKVDEHDPA
jgi:hypothetical protein